MSTIHDGIHLKSLLSNIRESVEQDRYNIIENAASLFLYHCKVDENFNIHSLIIPTLLAHIDRFYTDIKSELDRKLKLTKGRGLKHYSDQIDQADSERLKLIINHVFMNSYEVSEDMPDCMYRNKILHGEHFKYGSKENTIRAFIILEYLVEQKESLGEIDFRSTDESPFFLTEANIDFLLDKDVSEQAEILLVLKDDVSRKLNGSLHVLAPPEQLLMLLFILIEKNCCADLGDRKALFKHLVSKILSVLSKKEEQIDQNAFKSLLYDSFNSGFIFPEYQRFFSGF